MNSFIIQLQKIVKSKVFKFSVLVIFLFLIIWSWYSEWFIENDKFSFYNSDVDKISISTLNASTGIFANKDINLYGNSKEPVDYVIMYKKFVKEIKDLEKVICIPEIQFLSEEKEAIEEKINEPKTCGEDISYRRGWRFMPAPFRMFWYYS